MRIRFENAVAERTTLGGKGPKLDERACSAPARTTWRSIFLGLVLSISLYSPLVDTVRADDVNGRCPLTQTRTLCNSSGQGGLSCPPLTSPINPIETANQDAIDNFDLSNVTPGSLVTIQFTNLLSNTAVVTLAGSGGDTPPPGIPSSGQTITLVGSGASATTTHSVVAGEPPIYQFRATVDAQQAVSYVISCTPPPPPTPAIAIVKTTSSPTYSAVGQVLTYSLLITNTGNVPLTTLSINDPNAVVGACAPVALGGTLNAGGTTTCSATHPVVQADINAGSYINTATATGTFDGAPVTSQPSSVTSTATQTPAITIVKTTSTPTYSAVGQVLNYSLLVTNTGNVTLTNLAINDPNAVLGACAAVPIGGTLNPGQSTTCAATHPVVQADINAGSYINTATATGNHGNVLVSSQPSSVTSTATQTPAITIVKTTSTPTYSAVGQVLSYSLLVTNTGNVPLTSLAINDPNAVLGACAAVPIGGTLNPGQATTCAATHPVVQADINAGSYTNTATATGTFNNAPVTSQPSSVTSTATQTPAITVVKTTTTPTYSAVGQVLNYSLLVTNTGNVTLTNLAINDPNAALGACAAVSIGGALNPGQSTTCAATHPVVQADINAGSYTNTATATGTFNNAPVTSDPSSVKSTAVRTPAITIVKTTSTPTYSAVGQTLTYSLLVTNTGNVPLTSLAINDPNAVLGACSAVPIGGTLNPGQATTCAATHPVVQADINAGSYTNTATATGTFDGAPVTSQPSSVTSTAVRTPAITIVKTTSTPTYSTVGQVLTYSLLVTNTGNVTLTNLAINDPNAVLGACAAVSLGGTLNPGQATTCAATHSVVQADINAGSYTNTATATGTFNNAPVTSQPSSVTSKLISGTVRIIKNTQGGDGSFTFNATGIASFTQVINTAGGTGSAGPITVNQGQLTITETVAAGFTLSSVSCDGGSPVTNLANRTVTIDVVAGASITCTFTNVRRGSLTIRKNTIGGDATFGFTSSNAALASFQLATSGGTASSTFNSLPAGTYVVTETLASGWTLSSVNCSGGSQTSVNVQSRSATIVLAGGESVSCTFVNTEVRERTTTIISNFMKKRGDLITSDTGRPRLIERMQDGVADSSAPLKLTAMGDNTAGRLTFGTSLRQVLAFRAQLEAVRRAQATGSDGVQAGVYDPIEDARARFIDPTRQDSLGIPGLAATVSGGPGGPAHTSVPGLMTAATTATAPGGVSLGVAGGAPLAAAPREFVARPGWDIWIEGKHTYFDFNSEGQRSNGNFSMLKLGADYLLTQRLLVGALLQFDNMADRSDVLGYRIRGTGWMAGPYLEYMLSKNLIFDVKGLWGQSNNDISPFATYTDTFHTDRWLLSARLTGSWRYDNWHFSPRAEVVGYKDTQKAYVDSNGIAIPEQSISLGRVIVGPEISYTLRGQGGMVYEPMIGIKGLWTFSQDDKQAVLGTLRQIEIDEFRLRLEAGIKVQSEKGTRLEFSGSHDGFGASKMNATTGRAALTLPLN